VHLTSLEAALNIRVCGRITPPPLVLKSGLGFFAGFRGSMSMPSYAYIVVGVGSARAVIANRLSVEQRDKLLLLEAGRASHPCSRIPIGYARLIVNSAANWLHRFFGEVKPIQSVRAAGLVALLDLYAITGCRPGCVDSGRSWGTIEPPALTHWAIHIAASTGMTGRSGRNATGGGGNGAL
jgi:hypothetical protein